MDLTKSGELICKLRKSRKMTQKQIADILGIEAKPFQNGKRDEGSPIYPI